MVRHRISVIVVEVRCADVDAVIGKVAEVEVVLFSMMIVNCSEDGVVPARHGETVDEIEYPTGCPIECPIGYLNDCPGESLIDCPGDFLIDCLIASEIAMETGTAPLVLLNLQWTETVSEICAIETVIATANVILTDGSDSIDKANLTIDALNAMIGTDLWNLGKEQIALRVDQKTAAPLDQHRQSLILYPLLHPLLDQIVCPNNYHWTKAAKDLYSRVRLVLMPDATASVPKRYLARNPPRSPSLFLNIRLLRQLLKSLHLDLCLLPYQPFQRLRKRREDPLEAMPRYKQRRIAQMDL